MQTRLEDHVHRVLCFTEYERRYLSNEEQRAWIEAIELFNAAEHKPNYPAERMVRGHIVAVYQHTHSTHPSAELDSAYAKMLDLCLSLCPFCQAEAEMVRNRVTGCLRIGCTKCPARMPVSARLVEAVASWNTRK